MTAQASDRLANRILLGMVIGVVVALLVRWLSFHIDGLEAWAAWASREILLPFGNVFLRLLFFVVVPLVFASLTLGIVQLGRLDRLGPLAGRTFALFVANMAVGVVLGLLFMNIVQPGAGMSGETRDRILAEQQAGAETRIATSERQREEGFDFNRAVEMFLPQNLLRAVVDFNVLPLIAFALLCGAAGTLLEEERRRALRGGLEIVAELMMRIVGWALKLAPFAVAALVASAVLRFGLEYLQVLAVFTVGVLAVMALHLFVVLGIAVKVLGGRSPAAFFGAVRTVLVTAFSTSSSNATLPTSMAVARDRLGVSAPVTGFVMPLGATMNMSGTALYEGCVVLLVAQVYGLSLGLDQQLVLVLLAVVSAVAVAGIPGGSLPIIVSLLVYYGLPPEGIALVLGVDRLLDMARTTVNVGADLVTAVIVDRSERQRPADGTV